MSRLSVAFIELLLLTPLALAQKAEIAVGRQFAKQIEGQYRISPDPAVTGYARRVAGSIVQSAGMNAPVTVKVIESSEVRAFNFPRGFLYVTTGLIARAETEAEFAGVLAHEIAHLKANRSDAPRDLLGCTRWALNSKVPLTSLTELRDIEQETDTAAIEYLRAAGYDPLGMIEFYNKLRYEEPKLAQTWSSQDLMALHGYVEQSVPPDPEFIVNTAAFDAVRKRFLSEQKPVPAASRPTLKRVNSPVTVR